MQSSYEERESLVATLELLTDRRGMKRLAQAHLDLAAGHLTTHEEMSELLERRREPKGD